MFPIREIDHHFQQAQPGPKHRRVAMAELNLPKVPTVLRQPLQHLGAAFPKHDCSMSAFRTKLRSFNCD